MANLKNTRISDTGFIELPAGTTLERPGSPTTGMTRFNTDTSQVETWNGTSWVQAIDFEDGNRQTAASVQYFTSTGPATFNVPSGVTKVHVLVVAGGGSGGHQVGGGGGAGGMVEVQAYPVEPGGSVAVNVGAGGNAPGFQPSNNFSQPGGPSSFGLITAIGGGGGGNHIGTRSGPGDPGGSGGGAGSGPGGSGQGGATQTQYPQFGYAVGHGFPGGNGHASPGWSGGGGGGAGGRADNAGPDRGGDGGPGRISWITGQARYYAGGGGGGSENPGSAFWGRAGIGGGGRGSNNDGGKNQYPDMNGKPNTGGGGGGTRDHPSGAGLGGPGVVIVRY